MSMPRHWDPISEQDFRTSWPISAEKCELIDGVIVWYGRFSAEDCRAAERAFPGRRAVIDTDGNLQLHPGRPDRGCFSYDGAAYLRPLHRGVALGTAADAGATDLLGALSDLAGGDALDGREGRLRMVATWDPA